MDPKVRELALEILKTHCGFPNFLTMKEAVELAKKTIAGWKRDEERKCNLPRR